jgi:hypothetical protein
VNPYPEPIAEAEAGNPSRRESALTERQLRLAGKFVAVEEGLSRLYATFAGFFTRDCDLWDGLSNDERRHGEMAGLFLESAKRGELAFRDPRAQESLLDNLLKDIADIREAVRAGGVDRGHAVRLALDLESTVVEREAFRHYVGRSPEVKRTLELLDRETMAHGDKLRLWKP